MPLSAGEKLGVYEILSPLGAGGMGEVYRARDSKLGREVAIKVLPEEFTQHPQKLARFEREARLLASLNHPGIATLHGLEEAEGKPFLVMELVEGETLADRISRGAIPVGEALEISRQIAEALEAAHEKGVIHRDLKPANVKVDPEGHVKVLDFGLAKAFADEVPEGELSQSPTLSRDATRAGVILGTAAYMSPEQAKGKAVDKRSDIFSFGALLYEMLTGKKAFPGEDVSDVLAGVIKSEPDWKALPIDLSPLLRRLLRRCLTKERKERLRDIGDVRLDINEAMKAPSAWTADVQPSIEARRARHRERWVWTVITLLLAVAVAGLYLARTPAEPIVTKLSIVLPENLTFVGQPDGGIEVSPDGRSLAFRARDDSGETRLWVRSFGSMEVQPLPDTEPGSEAFSWSPDSRSITFSSRGQLKKVDLSGSRPVTLAEAVGGGVGAGGRGMTWSREGLIVFTEGGGGNSVISRVSVEGGAATQVTVLDESRQENSHRWPYFLPDGRRFLYTARSSIEQHGICVGSIDSTGPSCLLGAFSKMAYAPPGYLLFVRDGALLAQPFDPTELRLTGEPTALADGVIYNPGTGGASFSVSRTGVLVHAAGGQSQPLRWVDRRGRLVEDAVSDTPLTQIELSQDARRVVGQRVDPEVGSSDIWTLDLSRGISSRLTFDPAWDQAPILSPDGTEIIFMSARQGRRQWYRIGSAGTGEEELLFEPDVQSVPRDWSRDQNLVMYERYPTSDNADLWVVEVSDPSQRMPFLDRSFNEAGGQFSPDGNWVAYVSDESGQYEVYVLSFPDGNRRQQVSLSGGMAPRWRSDGGEIFYIAPDGQLMAVEVTMESELGIGVPEPMFLVGGVVGRRRGRPYAVSSDGQRFLLGSREEEVDSFTVVLNWAAELERLATTN